VWDISGGPDGIAHVKEFLLAEEPRVTAAPVLTEEGVWAERRCLEML
jgi:hypothetical protein